MSALAAALADRRVVVCAGGGGVGKTTVSAALAVGLAHGGARVALVTIDPARRLADALGLPWLGNVPTRVPVGDGGRGELWALMLDAQRTLDDLVTRIASSDAARRAVLENRIYAELATALSGSEAFTAMAKLEELVADARFDVVVLDTPPARDARSFLEAPDRLEAFLRGAALRRLLAPGRGAARLLGRGTGLLMPALRRVAGVQALEDVRVFLAVIEDLLGGFHERAVAVRALLADRSTAFVVVSSTEDAALADAAAFAAALRAAGRTPAALVVNRVHALDPAFDPGRAVTRLEAAGLPPRTARQAVAVHADVQVLARRDAAAVARAREAVGAPAVSVAQRPGGPHDLRALAAVAREMLASGETRSESRASYG